MTTTLTTIARRLALPALIAGLGLLALPACNIVGPAAVLISGPPKVPAVASLDESRPTVLLIDDLNSRLPRSALRDRIGRSAEADMLRAGTIDEGRLIASSSARRATAGDTNQARTPIVDVGRAVGAEVVVHVAVERWGLVSQVGEFSPEALLSVRILDALSNQRIWPDGEASFFLRVDFPMSAIEVPSSSSEQRRLEDAFADRIGVAISKMFYDAERERISETRDF